MNQPFIKNARFTFHSLAWIFAVGILIQVFLAGLALFADSAAGFVSALHPVIALLMLWQTMSITWKTRLFPRTAEDIHE